VISRGKRPNQGKKRNTPGKKKVCFQKIEGNENTEKGAPIYHE
jgi:hypothetical protein